MSRLGSHLGAVCRIASLLFLTALPARGDVFSGDPIDPTTGRPRVLLPGAPLVHPGPDEKYGTGDDVFDAGFVGDVDLVLRSGGAVGGGPLPPPASGVASAPSVRPGGGALGGTEVAFDVIASDGAAAPPGGNPLAGPELNGRGALVFAFADLDGDGFIGPTGSDGDADVEIERQEVLSPVGRQVAVFLAGAASGGLGVSLGAPASAGGLGLVLVAGAVTGVEPPVYVDGTWIATLLPFMPSTDPDRILGGNAGGADPEYLADVELEMDSDRHWIPGATHPVIGEPFAIPLDGSSISVDLARAESGAAIAAGLGIAVDAASYVAAPDRRLLPALDPTGTGRVLIDPSATVALADDGPGGAKAVLLFAADLLGNPADPAAPLAVDLSVGSRLRIAVPDSDGDPGRETVLIGSATSIAIALDDAGATADSAGADRLVATLGGVPTAAVDVQVGAAPPASEWLATRATLSLGRDPVRGSLRISGSFDAAAIDPATQTVTVSLVQGVEVLYERTFPPGTLLANPAGDRLSFRDAPSTGTARVRSIVLKRRTGNPARHHLRLVVRPLDLSRAAPADGPVELGLQVGASLIEAPLDCAANLRETALRCARP